MEARLRDLNYTREFFMDIKQTKYRRDKEK